MSTKPEAQIQDSKGFELYFREVKAGKIATLLQEHGLTSSRVAGFNESQWTMAAQAAHVNYPSEQTRDRVVVLMRQAEVAAKKVQEIHTV